jgi:hypothetical protein
MLPIVLFLLVFLVACMVLFGYLLAVCLGVWGLWAVVRMARGRTSAGGTLEKRVLLAMLVSAAIASPVLCAVLWIVSLSS